MKDLFSPVLIWFVIGLVLVLAEFAAPGILLLFFGVGAWIVCVLCIIADVSLNVQLFVFLTSSLVLLFTLRKWLKTVFLGHSEKGETDRLPDEFTGLTAQVVKKIEPGFPGKVEFRGTQWSAEAAEIIEECQPVEIVKRNNITLVVKPLQRR